jgi:perosamine synthetase
MTPSGMPRRSPRSFEPDVIASALSALEEGRLFRYDARSPQASPTACFERDFADFIGLRYAVAVNSCSSALFLSLLGCGVGTGDEVLVPAFTFVAVPSAVVHAGARPVLVEMTPDLVVDPDDLERKITPRTKALLLSYMRGRVPDLDRVLEVCRRRRVTVIEDVAHGMGIEWDGLPLGRYGRVAAFSFQSYKLLDGGEGGMVVTDDREVALRALLQAGCYDRNWQWHFLDADDQAWLESATNSLPAYGLRMSNLTAAVVGPQLGRVHERVAQYRARYKLVTDALVGSPIRFPAHSARMTPVPDSLQFEVLGFGPDQLGDFVRRCSAQGLPLQVMGLDPSNSRCYWHWGFVGAQECPRTRDLLMRTADMTLPLWLDERVLVHFGQVIRDSLAAAS